MQTVLSIIITLLILTFIVVIHEWGHFIVARACGVFVEEFSIGMGPKLFGFKTKKDMQFSVRLLPIGGYCKMRSRLEDELDALSNAKKNAEAEPETEVIETSEPQKSVFGQYNMEDISTWKRILMFLAGPLMNFVLALFLATFITMMTGFIPNKVGYVSPNSAAEGAGLQVDDEFYSIDGERAYNYYKTSYILSSIPDGTTVDFVVLRDGEKVTIPIASTYKAEENRYMYGIGWTFVGSMDYELANRGAAVFFEVFVSDVAEGFWEIVFNLEATLDTIWGMLTGQVGVENMSGVIGVVGIVEDVYEEASQSGFWMVVLNMINIAMLLSASLCIMNLLPIPALDGGQMVILVIEKIIGHPLSAKARIVVAIVGWVIIIALMVVVGFNDIVKLFK